ncbi:type VI secretion protein IcmF [Salmonella bongori]|nr:type VI secretion protein IcmF [Salmonella bongori]
MSLPVYLIVSGLEEIEGTQDLLTLLSDEAKRSPIGSAIPVAREAIWKSVWIDDALANTRHTLRDVITALGTLHGHTSGTLFRLPEFFPTIATPLHDYFDTLLNSSARDEPPLLRGIWFVARSAIADKPHMQFCQNLLEGKIIAESGLALPVRRLLRLNLRRHFITLACYSCAGILWLVAMIWSWHYQHTNALVLHDRLQLLATQTARDSNSGERTATLYWRILNAVPQWQFRSIVLARFAVQPYPIINCVKHSRMQRWQACWPLPPIASVCRIKLPAPANFRASMTIYCLMNVTGTSPSFSPRPNRWRPITCPCSSLCR